MPESMEEWKVCKAIHCSTRWKIMDFIVNGATTEIQRYSITRKRGYNRI